jgi:hypothetical protein
MDDPFCADACGPTADCDLRCLGSGDPYGIFRCGTWGGGAPDECYEPYCGDGVCNAGEDCQSCPDDCGDCSPDLCGNDTCDWRDGESWRNCPDDCDPPDVNDDGDYVCGDGENGEHLDCQIGEFCASDDDCANVPMEDYGYSCIANFCVANEFMDVTEACDPANLNYDCAFACEEMQDIYPWLNCDEPWICVATENELAEYGTPACMPTWGFWTI